MSGNRAPSLILWHGESCPGDILTLDACVPGHGAAQCTYYCCLNWNAGANGGGYCGIQDHPDGRCYIFSIWDPHNTRESITAVYRHPGTNVEPFGGEGTGLKSMNFAVGWEPDHWYTAVVRRWDHNEHTRFGFWIHDQTGNKWTHLVTMDFPEPNIFFNHTASFLEDWHGNGHLVRCVKYKSGRKRSDGAWRLIKTANFYVNQEDACRNYNHSFNATVDSDCYVLQSGQNICPHEGLGTTQELCCGSSEEDIHSGETVDSQPTNPPIRFTVEARLGEVQWTVHASEVPQFQYTIKSGDRVLITEVDSEKRSVEVDLVEIPQITLCLEDIMGRTTAKTCNVNQY